MSMSHLACMREIKVEKQSITQLMSMVLSCMDAGNKSIVGALNDRSYASHLARMREMKVEGGINYPQAMVSSRVYAENK